MTAEESTSLSAAILRFAVPTPATSPSSDGGLLCYAVVDAARSKSLTKWLSNSSLRFQSLYAGTSAITLADQAPYLVHLPSEEASSHTLLNTAWGQNMMLFAYSTLPFDLIRLELKKKLVVLDESGASFYFRFYDPRVAARFLATADREGVRWWFTGGIHAFRFESNEADCLVTVTPDGAQMHPIKPASLDVSALTEAA